MDIIIMTTYVQWSVSDELFIHSKIISKKVSARYLFKKYKHYNNWNVNI